MTARALPRERGGGETALIALGICIGVASVAGGVTALTGSLLPLVAAGAAALGLLVLLRPAVGTFLFLGLLWLNVPGVLARFHNVPDLLATASVALLVVPVARYLLTRQPVIITPTFYALVFFLAANLFSATTSSSPDVAMNSVITLVGEGLLIYFLVSNAIRTVAHAQMAIWVLVAASVVMAGLSIHQEATEAYRDPYLGFSQTTRLEDPVTAEVRPDSRPRMMGPIGEQNRYAQILLVVLPLALFGMNIRHPLWGRLVPALAAVLILGGIFLTFSRGAAVALGLLMVVLVIRRYVRFSHMIAIVGAFVLTVVIIAPEFLGRVESIGSASALVSEGGEDPDGAILGRATSNVAALLVFADYPIFGVGPGVYPVDYSVEYANELGLRYFTNTRRAHNMYLEWAADLGVLGLTAGVALLVVTLVPLARLRTFWQGRRSDYATLAGAVSLAVIAYAVSAIFLHLSYLRYFFTLLALANSVIWILERERNVLPGADARPAPGTMPYDDPLSASRGM